MVLPEKDANAQILRIFTDFSTKSNQYLLTNLKRVVEEALDQSECFYEAKNPVDAAEGLLILKRNYKLNNIDIAYLLILITRGYKFRNILEKVYLCEEEAILPDFERFPPFKPKFSDSFDTKTTILNSIIECQTKKDEELLQELVKSIPELLERSFGVLYTGRYLSINEWIHQKEKEGKWLDDEVLRYGNYSLTPWMLANILVLQARGWYLQEIPEKYKGSDFVFTKK